jgi:flagellar basal body-associated protein FliL
MAVDSTLQQTPIDLDAASSTPPSNVLTRSISVEKYDPIQATDNARKYIAYWLIAILAGLVVIGCVALFFILLNKNSTKDDYDHLVGVLNIIFGPMVTFVGSATGFYFGSQSRTAQQTNAASSER